MPDEFHTELAHLLEKLVSLDEFERETFIRDMCGEDDRLRDELLSLLEHYDSAKNPKYLQPPAQRPSGASSLEESLRKYLSRRRMSEGDTSGRSDALPETRHILPSTTASRSDIELPARIDRYTILETLGSGAFAVVCRARDEQLGRDVAIKIPRQSLSSADERKQFVAEARAAAELDHPGIVPVYDIVCEPGKEDNESQVYIVQRLIGGPTLGDHLLNTGPFEPRAAATLLVDIADAIAHAHRHRVTHTDLKPGNILLDATSGKPVIADLGLAVKQAVLPHHRHVRAGTPHYMAPEQVRGERHRLDGRTDIWALGVILFEVLTGERPFSGNTVQDLLHNIDSGRPWPLRQARGDVPREIARICEKCLQPRMSDRYQTAADLAHDLRRWLDDDESGKKSGEMEPAHARATTVVPQGLRSFTANDSDFYLSLLPGPRDYRGLPEAIRFWKQRVESTAVEDAIPVGLIYGPSGCGKTSLLRAGLIPRLAGHVVPILVEALADGTEARLTERIRRTFSDLPAHDSLVELVAALREGGGLHPGQKALLFLDQFEQWLHTHRDVDDSVLVRALRHCDGTRLQCVLLVRDDFWLSTSRFLRALDIPLVEHNNTRLIDLFDPPHAQHVLTEFGRGYNRLPPGPLSQPQEVFIQNAVESLAVDGRVTCVRLALFADMVKSQEWLPDTLDKVGGVEGLGVTFLEQTFSSRSARLHYRSHEDGARNVLKALLPDGTSDIRGCVRSHRELLEASGYGSRGDGFESLLSILDQHVRLITPTAPSESESGTSSVHFQLTHDYLVPSIREWVTRKQKETRRGRAELHLEDRAALWNRTPENRLLPSGVDFIRLRALTDRKHWSESESRMMQRARRVHGVRWSVSLIALTVLALATMALMQRVDRRRSAARADGLVDAIMAADVQEVADLIRRLEALREWANPRLRQICDTSKPLSRKRLHAALALVPDDDSQVEYLVEHLLSTEDPSEVPVIVELLNPYSDRLRRPLWNIVQDQDAWGRRQLRASCALARFDPRDPQWRDVRSPLADQLVRVSTVHLQTWTTALRPIAGELAYATADIFEDPNRSSSEHLLAKDILIDFGQDSPALLARAIQSARPDEFEDFLVLLESHRNEAIAILDGFLQEGPRYDWNDTPFDPEWAELNGELIAELDAAGVVTAKHFAFCQHLPLQAFEDVSSRLAACGYRPLRVRPFITADEQFVAVTWWRDGRGWHWLQGSAEELRRRDQQLRRSGFAASDVSFIRTIREDSSDVHLFSAVWVTVHDGEPDSRLLVGLTPEEARASMSDLSESGIQCRIAFSQTPDVHGKYLVSMVAAERGSNESVSDVYLDDGEPRDRHLDMLQNDLQLARALRPTSVDIRYGAQLEEAEALIALVPSNTGARYNRAVAKYFLGDYHAARAELESLLAETPAQAKLHRFLALTCARLGDAEAADEHSQRFADMSASEAGKSYLRAMVRVLLGEVDSAIPELEDAIMEHQQDGDSLFWLVGPFCAAAEAVRPTDSPRADRYLDRAVAVLNQSLDAGMESKAELLKDPDLAPLYEYPPFLEVMARQQLDRHYVATWGESTLFESISLRNLTPAEHRSRSTELVARGYRPVLIDVAEFGDGELVAASLWHRPVIAESVKEELAQRQTKAAVALLRLNSSNAVWPLFRHRVYPEDLRAPDDPRLRSFLIHALSAHGVDPRELIERLDEERDVSVRRALTLALGEYPPGLIPEDERRQFAMELLDAFREESDAGLHAAVEWILQVWGYATELNDMQTSLAENEDQLSVRQSRRPRNWYITTEGHTMVVLPPVQVLVGSSRLTAPDHADEWLHRKHITRSFALSATEVTRAQYRRFQESSPHAKVAVADHVQVVSLSSTEDSPIVAVDWYEAAAYCNWLSAQEGIPEDQWIYVPNETGDFAAGMRIREGYQDLNGYRLPSEAEWEFACRAGAATTRHFGHSPELLEEYAWFTSNSGDRIWPIGRLKPNDLGFFDMHGNVWEWCHNQSTTWSASHLQDPEDSGPVVDDSVRALRGGAYNHLPPILRSAYRHANLPLSRNMTNGFRPARTLPFSAVGSEASAEEVE